MTIDPGVTPVFMDGHLAYRSGGIDYTVGPNQTPSFVFTSLLAQRGQLARQATPGDPFRVLEGEPLDTVAQVVAASVKAPANPSGNLATVAFLGLALFLARRR